MLKPRRWSRSHATAEGAAAGVAEVAAGPANAEAAVEGEPTATETAEPRNERSEGRRVTEAWAARPPGMAVRGWPRDTAPANRRQRSGLAGGAGGPTSRTGVREGCAWSMRDGYVRGSAAELGPSPTDRQTD